MRTRKAIISSFTAAILVASATTAMAASQGLYSADELMDADVYLANQSEPIGEVEDLILDNGLTVGAFVIETNSVLGVGGESHIVSVEDVRVTTVSQGEDKQPEYRVTVDATAKQFKAYPEYSDSWWNNVRTQAGEVWTQTQKAAGDAWSRVKAAAGDLIN